MINIYCDESCHLEKDYSDIMALGALSCDESNIKDINKDIRNLKIKHGLSSWFEIKWTKVSIQKIDFYLELIDYFFNNPNLMFRAVVIRNKKSLDHYKYNNSSHNNWYYKMYFQLLNKMISNSSSSKVLLDVKDTQGGLMISELQRILRITNSDINGDIVKEIVQIRSHESEILQLTDLFIGLLTYYNRGLYDLEGSNKAKNVIAESLLHDRMINLSQTTSLSEKKFNLFFWEPRR